MKKSRTMYLSCERSLTLQYRNSYRLLRQRITRPDVHIGRDHVGTPTYHNAFSSLATDFRFDTDDEEGHHHHHEYQQESNTMISESSLQSHYVSIPSDMSSMINSYAQQQPTAVSLQMLIHAGKGLHGDFWGRTYHSASNKHLRSSSSSPNLMMITSPHRRLGLDTQYSKERITIQMADFLRKELPIRLAHQIQNLDQVRYLRHMSSVQDVKNIYINSLQHLTSPNIPKSIRTTEEEQQFAKLLSSLYETHASVLVQMAKGAYQLRNELRRQHKEEQRLYFSQWNTRSIQDGSTSDETQIANTKYYDNSFAQMNECHEFLNRFYMSRIGIRFLAAQYLTLRNTTTTNNNNTAQQTPNTPSSPSPQQSRSSTSHQSSSNVHHRNSYIGMICQETSPSQCVRQATMDASMMCRRMYGRCPRVDVTGQLDLTFPYIPTYLHYIVLELLKNSLRATMETHMNSNTLPPVQVVIADGVTNEDVVIKIADCGGGIKRSQMDQIWSYLFTTADPKIQELFVGNNNNNNNNNNTVTTMTNNNTTTTTTTTTSNHKDHSYEAPLAGLGYGLPISRSYCRYFGGDLDIISMEGYGTDAFVYLKRLGDSKEPVPI